MWPRSREHRWRALSVVVALLSILSSAGCGSIQQQGRGDPRAGLSVFKFARCASCHTIASVADGARGPALNGEGSLRNVVWMRRFLPAHIRSSDSVALSPGDREDVVTYLMSLR